MFNIMDDYMDVEPTVVDFSETELQNVVLDLGLLLVTNSNIINKKKWSQDKDGYMQSEAQKAVGMILKGISELPTKEYKDVEVIELPAPAMVLPRAMPPPKKYKTKWQEFAAKKGIKKHKKEKKEWDEDAQKWRPTFGAKSKKNQQEWLLEVPENADPNMDMYAKKKNEKKERVSKNEYQRLQNIARAQKAELAKLAPTKKDLNQAVILAREATASMGKFDPMKPEEKNLKKKGVKRSLPSDSGDLEKENEKILKVFNLLQRKKPKLDQTKAANLEVQSIMEENRKKGGGGKKKKDLSSISRHQKFGKMSKNKKQGGKKAKAAAKHGGR